MLHYLSHGHSIRPFCGCTYYRPLSSVLPRPSSRVRIGAFRAVAPVPLWNIYHSSILRLLFALCLHGSWGRCFFRRAFDICHFASPSSCRASLVWSLRHMFVHRVFPRFLSLPPSPSLMTDVPHNGLTTRVDMDMLNGNLLFTLVPVFAQSLQLRRIEP
jgi:hypothetical protein